MWQHRGIDYVMDLFYKGKNQLQVRILSKSDAMAVEMMHAGCLEGETIGHIVYSIGRWEGNKQV